MHESKYLILPGERLGVHSLCSREGPSLYSCGPCFSPFGLQLDQDQGWVSDPNSCSALNMGLCWLNSA